MRQVRQQRRDRDGDDERDRYRREDRALKSHPSDDGVDGTQNDEFAREETRQLETRPGDDDRLEEGEEVEEAARHDERHNEAEDAERKKKKKKKEKKEKKSKKRVQDALFSKKRGNSDSEDERARSTAVPVATTAAQKERTKVGEVSMDIEETNVLRAKLGLKPLK